MAATFVHYIFEMKQILKLYSLPKISSSLVENGPSQKQPLSHERQVVHNSEQEKYALDQKKLHFTH